MEETESLESLDTEVLQIVSHIAEEAFHVEDDEEHKEFKDDRIKDTMDLWRSDEEMLSDNVPDSVRISSEIIDELLDFIQDDKDIENTEITSDDYTKSKSVHID